MSDIIEHGLVSKLLGSVKEKHKYILRIELPNKKGKARYRYFYTKEAANAFRNKKKEPVKSKVEEKKPEKEHKYLLKLKLENGKFRYFYDQKEIDSFMSRFKNLSAKNLVDTIDPNAGDKQIGNFILIVPEPIKNAIKESVKDAAKKISDFLFPSKKAVTVLPPTPIPSNKEPEPRRYEKVPKTEGLYVVDSRGNVYNNQVEQDVSHGNASVSITVDNALPKKEKTMTEGEDQAAVNPHYEEASALYLECELDYLSRGNAVFDDPEFWEKYDAACDYTENCLWCTETYDLRRRGYDVTAGKGTDKNYDGTILELYDHYEDPVIITPKEGNYVEVSKMLEQETSSYGDGSYGQFMVYWWSGGGHSMVWSVENGQTIVRDSQTNQTHTFEDILADVDTEEVGNVFICRTDNLDIKPGILEVVAKEDKK